MFGVAIETTARDRDLDDSKGEYERMFEQVDDAPNIPRLASLAQDLWDVQTALGITDGYARLRATAKFVQSFPYASAIEDGRKPPLYCFHTHEANCTEKTAIYGAILRCKPYDTRLSVIYCDLIGQGAHAVGGIDMNHINTSQNTDDLFTVSPSDYSSRDGHPGGDYAFIDLTDRSNAIGEFDSDSYDIRALWFTNRLEGKSW